MAGAWMAACRAVDVISAGHLVREVDGRYLALFHVGGAFFAIDDECTHDGGSLDGATVDGLEVICPRHGARFCLRTGAALSPPAYSPVRTYPVRVSGEQLEVELDVGHGA